MKNLRQEVIYKGVIYYGDGEDTPLPFEMEYFRGGHFTITRTDGKPFDQDFIADFTYYDDSNAKIENKSSPHPYTIRIQDHITHYSFSWFGGKNGEVKTLKKRIRYEDRSLEDLKYMSDLTSCNIDVNEGTFFLCGEFFSDTVNVTEVFEKMQGHYNIDLSDIGEGDVKDAITEIYSVSGKEDALNIDKLMEHLYQGEDISKMKKNTVKYFEDLNNQ